MEAIGLIFAALYALWLLFILYVAIERALDDLGPLQRTLLLPVIIAGVVLDVIVNVAASIPFFDLPREWTLSQRLKRYCRLPSDNWRCIVATAIRHRMLWPFDPGH